MSPQCEPNDVLVHSIHNNALYRYERTTLKLSADQVPFATNSRIGYLHRMPLNNFPFQKKTFGILKKPLFLSPKERPWHRHRTMAQQLPLTWSPRLRQKSPGKTINWGWHQRVAPEHCVKILLDSEDHWAINMFFYFLNNIQATPLTSLSALQVLGNLSIIQANPKPRILCPSS